MYTEFQLWFADCVLLCCYENIGPHDYMWNMQDCPEWVARFEAGMTPQEAVAAEFRPH